MPGLVRWLIVVTIVALVLVAAFWRPTPLVHRLGPFGLLDRRTWVTAAAYGTLTLSILYALVPAGRTDAVSPLFVPLFVLTFALLVELAQFLSGVAPLHPIDLLGTAVSSGGVALVWDAGRKAVRTPLA